VAGCEASKSAARIPRRPRDAIVEARWSRARGIAVSSVGVVVALTLALLWLAFLGPLLLKVA
jgi:hypothetical protein